MTAPGGESPTRHPVALIEQKKRGEEMSAGDLRFLCDGFVAGEIPDYQMAAWLMAVCWRGMSARETLALTEAIVATGTTLDWSDLPTPPVDKHSTGGVGDKTSLVLVPLMAAAGLPFVKMSGRGLGHTGGTLDKLESIPGFRVGLEPAELRAQVERIGCALIGQSPELAPADGKLYALRDVTGTVDAVPLIASSILSKKLAAGARTLVLDVKWGSGAFMQTLKEARVLARTMVEIGEGAGRRTRAVLSPMEQPLGRAVGNALEVREAIDTLHGDGPADLWELTLELGAQLLILAEAAPTLEEAQARLKGLLRSGAAARKFAELIEAQGGDPAVVDEPDRLPRARHVETLCSTEHGGSTEHGERWVAALDARVVGDAALELGAGRRAKGDPLDLAAGIRLLAKTGDGVEKGQPLAELHASDPARAERAATILRRAYRLQDSPADPLPFRAEIISAATHPN